MTDAIDSLAVIRRLHEHRVWVNRRLRDAAARLTDAQLRQPFEIGRGSVWATLAHLYGAESNWLEALHGDENPPLLGPEAFDDLSQLDYEWDRLEERWSDYLDTLTPAQLAAPVRKRSSTVPGPALTTRVLDVVLHVATHAQYTTAQAANMLRRLGVPPPDTMLITLARIQHPENAP